MFVSCESIMEQKKKGLWRWSKDLSLVNPWFLFFILLISLSPFSGRANEASLSADIKVIIKDTQEQKLIPFFHQQSNIKKYQDSGFSTPRQRENVVQRDLDLLKSILESYGYFTAEINRSDKIDQDNIKVNFTVMLGKRAAYNTVDIQFTDDTPGSGQTKESIAQRLHKLHGQFVDASALFDLFETIEKDLANEGYLFAQIKDHNATLTQDKLLVDIRISISLGRQVKFGDLRLKGEENIPSDFIRNRLPWQRGDIFQANKLTSFQEKLYKTQLFDLAFVRPAETPNDQDFLDVIAELKERKERTIYGEIQQSFTDGLGAKVGWIHRNITNRADAFGINLKVSQRLSHLLLDHTLPDVGYVDQSLLTSLKFSLEDTKAFKSKGGEISFLLKNQYTPQFSFFYGLSFSRERVTREGIKENTTLVGTPLGVQWSETDDELDPKRGYKLSVAFVPEFGKFGPHHFLAKILLNGSSYIPLSEDLTWATWVRTGAILGINKAGVPANRKCYAGGAGSIRSYGYQMASPLDTQENPSGGNSLIEGGVELRYRFTKDWGAVIFMDAAHLPFTQPRSYYRKLFYGIGTGVRYYTSIGPIRFDIAIPLSKKRFKGKKSLDRAFQFYISIGQSF